MTISAARRPPGRLVYRPTSWQLARLLALAQLEQLATPLRTRRRRARHLEITMPKASLLPSILRTVVPLLVGLLLTWPITAGLGITEEQATAVTTTVVTAAYYLLVRLAEQYVPQLGWLLGYASAPLYKPATDVSR